MQTVAQLREQYSAEHIMAAAASILEERISSIGDVLNSPHEVKRFLQMKFGNENREHFGVLFVNSQHQVIKFEIMFSGSLNVTSVYPREVVKRILQLNAHAVILAHNHPSGNPEPSRADQALTGVLKQACELIGAQVLDHVIVAGSRAVSFAEQGLL